MKYIATISFGKDSTTMCDLLLKNGYPVDYIVFNDTLMEFPDMYKYKKRIEEYFKSRYGKEIITTKPDKTFEELVFGIIRQKGAEREGYIRGVPNLMAGFCDWRRDSKMAPMNKFLKDHKLVTQYVGFTLGENRHIDDTESVKYKFPLRDDFRMAETDCQKYLLEQEMENPLYRLFTRTGCAICPAQSDRAWFEVYKHYPDTWEYMRWIEKRLFSYIGMGYDVVNPYWFSGKRRIEDMENQFKKETTSLFDFSDEPLKDCFCKI